LKNLLSRADFKFGFIFRIDFLKKGLDEARR